MSEKSKKINAFFNTATKQEIAYIVENAVLSEHLSTVFHMKYIDGYEIDFIAYKTGYSRGKIEADLRKIRNKILKLL